MARVTKPIVAEDDEPVSPLRKEIVYVKFVPKEGKITDKKHVLYGGMAETAKRSFTVPRLQSGQYVNVLTDHEKEYFEQVLGLEENAMSIYRKNDNYWDNYFVTLTKQDTRLDLSVPEDYIKYKVLLANKQYIAPSQKELRERPLATYQFVITSDNSDVKLAKSKMDMRIECYKEYGKYDDNMPVLRHVVRQLTGRPTAVNVRPEFLQTQIDNAIQENPKEVLQVFQDPYLSVYVTIEQAVEQGLISKTGDYYKYRADNSYLCEDGEDPNLRNTAKYLANPKHQDLLFNIQSKLEL